MAPFDVSEVLARMSARAESIRRAGGPRQLSLDWDNPAPAGPCDSLAPAVAPIGWAELVAGAGALSGALVGKDTSVAGKRRRRCAVRESRSVVCDTWIESKLRRYGEVSIDGASDAAGVSYMLRWAETGAGAGLVEWDEGAGDAYSGSNTWRLIDYGWLLDYRGGVAPDCSEHHRAMLGHARYRDAVRRYGAESRQARRWSAYADYEGDSGAGRAGGANHYSAADRAMLRRAERESSED